MEVEVVEMEVEVVEMEVEVVEVWVVKVGVQAQAQGMGPEEGVGTVVSMVAETQGPALTLGAPRVQLPLGLPARGQRWERGWGLGAGWGAGRASRRGLGHAGPPCHAPPCPLPGSLGPAPYPHPPLGTRPAGQAQAAADGLGRRLGRATAAGPPGTPCPCPGTATVAGSTPPPHLAPPLRAWTRTGVTTPRPRRPWSASWTWWAVRPTRSTPACPRRCGSPTASEPQRPCRRRPMAAWAPLAPGPPVVGSGQRRPPVHAGRWGVVGLPRVGWGWGVGAPPIPRPLLVWPPPSSHGTGGGSTRNTPFFCPLLVQGRVVVCWR
jgi:hypothetical protein